MPTIDNLDIQISTSLKNSDKMLDNLITKLGTVSSSLSRVGGTTSVVSSGMTKTSTSINKTAKSTKSLASAFGKLYASYFLVVRGVKSLYDSIKGTADYIEAFNYFEVSFNKIADEWKQDYEKFGYDSAEAYADSFSKRAKDSLSKLSGVKIEMDAEGKGLLTETGMKNLGLNIQEITQYASQLASVTNSVSLTGEASLAAANSFTKLAGDISSLFNVDYSSVSKNLQSGLIGQSRALYKYGIDITNATLQTYAYELGLEKAVSEMTQAEKMQLRMIAILDQSKVSWGDLSNTINSPSNMIRQFTTNLKEAGMMLGQLFIPLLSKVLPVINGVTIAIKRLLGNIAGILGIKLDLDSFGQGASELDDSYMDVSDSLDDVADSAKKAKAGLRGFDELKTINMPETSSTDTSGLGSTIDLTNEIIAATEEYEKVWQEAYDKMEQRAQAFADTIEKAFSSLPTIIENVFDAFGGNEFIQNIQEGINKINFEKIKTNFQTIYNEYSKLATVNTKYLAQISTSWNSMSGTISANLISLAGQSVEIISSSYAKFLTENSSKIANWAKTTALSISNGFFSLETGFDNIFSRLYKSIEKQKPQLEKSFSNILTSISNTAMSIGTVLSEMWESGNKSFEEFSVEYGPEIENFFGGIVKSVTDATETIAGIIEGLFGSVKTWWEDDGKSVWEGFSNMITDLIGIFLKFWNGTVQPIIDNLTKETKKLWEEHLEPLWEKVLGLVSSISNFFLAIWNKIKPVVDFLVEYVAPIISEVFSTISEKISVVFGIISDVLGGVIEALSGIIDFFTGVFTGDWEKAWEEIQGIVSGAWEAIWGIIEGVFKLIVGRDNWDKITGFFTDLWGNIKSIFASIGGWFKKNVTEPIKSKFDTATKGIEDAFGGIWSSIKTGAITAMNAVISGIESGINFVVGGINKLIGGFNKVVSWAADVVGEDWGGVTLVQKVSLTRIPVPKYEAGGFPDSASLFWANENGIPELIGTMGGKTAVASGMEITGIKDAIYSTGKQETNLMQTMVGLLRIIAEKEYGISDDQIGKSAQRYARDYFNRTGGEAFSF